MGVTQQSGKGSVKRKALRSTWLVLVIFALLFGVLSTTSMVQKSATFDEPNKLISGYANLKWGDYRLSPDHPPLARMITALPLLAFSIPDPRNQSPLWRDSPVDDNAQRLFTQRMLYGGGGDRVLFWGRIPVVVLAVFLGGFVFLWARELYGRSAAIVALVLYGFDPNILAHARLATSDLALTLFTFLSLYSFQRVCKKFTFSSALACSLLVACTVVSKHTGWLVCLALLILGGVIVFSDIHWPALLGELKPVETKQGKFALLFTSVAVTVLVIYFLIWAIYGFRYQAVSPPTPDPLSLSAPVSGPASTMLEAMKERRILPEAYLEGMLLALSRIGLGHRYFLLGESSTTGWWYYFLVAFLVKTPLPTLLLLGLACGTAIARRTPLQRGEIFLLIPVAVYFLGAMSSSYNLGLRYVLPVYPFLFVFIGRLAPLYEEINQRGKRAAAILFALWVLISSQSIYPHYLAYFNEFAGGAEKGHGILADSNLDWGQDLKGLKKWMVQNRVDLIGLSYFGAADPNYYDIPFVYLPSIPFYYAGHGVEEVGKAPEYFAISATNLHGVFLHEADRKIIDRFLTKEPIAKVGYSIFIYR